MNRDGDGLDRPLDCRELCLRVRFSLDEPLPLSESFRKLVAETSSERLARARSRSIRVSPRLMPDLHAAVVKVAERLYLEKPPEIWIQRDSTPNASAHVEGDRSIVVLNSGLVNLLTMEELTSVIGHEFAHVAFGHLTEMPEDEPQALLSLERMRASELSCDRIGLLAAPDLATAIRADLKIASGLEPTRFRFELESVLDHLAHHPDDVDAEWEAMSTHPAFAFRFWALLKFAESDLYRSLAGLRDGRPFAEVEREIEDRFLAAGGGLVFRETSRLVHSILAWAGVLMVAHDDSVTDVERETLVHFVGRLWAEDAVAYARRHGLKAVERRLDDALGPVGHVGTPTRKRIENAIRDFAGRTNLDGKADEILERIRKAGRPG